MDNQKLKKTLRFVVQEFNLNISWIHKIFIDGTNRKYSNKLSANDWLVCLRIPIRPYFTQPASYYRYDKAKTRPFSCWKSALTTVIHIMQFVSSYKRSQKNSNLSLSDSISKICKMICKIKPNWKIILTETPQYLILSHSKTLFKSHA